MKKLIKLCLRGNQWLAEYTGSEAEEIKALMGTALIPTAFLKATPREKVIERLEELNPGYKII